MSEELVLLSDREVLTRTLLETSDLLHQAHCSPMSTSLPLYWKAHVRVLWLLSTLCRSHLSGAQATSILQRSQDFARLLRVYDRRKALSSATTR